MDWRGKTGRKWAQSDGGTLYEVRTKRNGKLFVEANMLGGQEIRLPFQEFETEADAIAWVEERERKAAERREQAQNEPRIQF